MATRRSTRIANAVYKPQEDMIFSPSVMCQITKEYVDLFRKDISLKIIPLLTTCHLVSRCVVPQLYEDVTLKTNSQYGSFLKYASLNGVRRMREITTHMLESTSTMKQLTKDFGTRLKEHLKRNEESGSGVVHFFAGSADNAGIYLAQLLHPEYLYCWFTSSHDLSQINTEQFNKLKFLDIYLGIGSLMRWSENQYHLNRLQNLRGLAISLRADLEDFQHFDAWRECLTHIVDCTSASRIEVELEDYPHVFCFEDVHKEVEDTSGIVWYRCCPEGSPCVEKHTCTDEERAIRQAVRPRTTAAA